MPVDADHIWPAEAVALGDALLTQANERHVTRHDHRDKRSRVVCTFLATPDADARLRRVYEILLKSAAPETRPDGDEKETAPAPPGAVRSLSSTTTTVAQRSDLEDGHGR
jgi:hypothetical protein